MHRRSIPILAVLGASLGACAGNVAPPPTPTSPVAGRAMQAFASDLRLVMAEEDLAIALIRHADLAPGHGAATIPALQDAYRHLDKAAFLATGGGAIPYGDEASLLDVISDEQTTVQQMLADFGDAAEWADYKHLQEDHQRLLAMLHELQQRGY